VATVVGAGQRVEAQLPSLADPFCARYDDTAPCELKYRMLGSQ